MRSWSRGEVSWRYSSPADAADNDGFITTQYRCEVAHIAGRTTACPTSPTRLAPKYKRYARLVLARGYVAAKRRVPRLVPRCSPLAVSMSRPSSRTTPRPDGVPHAAFHRSAFDHAELPHAARHAAARADALGPRVLLVRTAPRVARRPALTKVHPRRDGASSPAPSGTQRRASTPRPRGRIVVARSKDGRRCPISHRVQRQRRTSVGPECPNNVRYQ